MDQADRAPAEVSPHSSAARYSVPPATAHSPRAEPTSHPVSLRVSHAGARVTHQGTLLKQSLSAVSRLASDVFAGVYYKRS